MKTNCRVNLAVLAVLGILTGAFGWRSTLYPADWLPGTIYNGKFLHDFSYAGYEKGEKEIPTSVAGNIYDVTKSPYNADKTGGDDATVQIQSAITAAQNAGGGTVYLPAGIYKVKPQGNNNYALRISGSNILFKGDGVGKTFIRCYAEDMPGKSIILVGQGGNWGTMEGNAVKITANVPDSPQFDITVENAAPFNVGDWIVIRSDRTTGWVNDHNMSGFWDNRNDLGLGTVFYRKITAKNGNKLTLDIPTRYWLNTRDNPRIYKCTPRTTNTGVQDFSIGNKENPTATGWGEEDYNKANTGASKVHGAFLIKFSGVVNGWARNISSYQAQNSKQVHMSSNGLDINQSARLTIDKCDFSYPQYRGGGGNGYGMNICGSDILISNCSSTSARHSYSFKYTYANGNVIYNHTSNTPVYGSDFHMYLSMSNLIDNQNLNKDFIESNVRPYGATKGNYHGHTSTQTVFWNANGIAGPGGNNANRIIDSRQHGYGYIIGTRGAAKNVQTTPTQMNSGYGNVNTAPEDHKEGIGDGAALEPKSLYYDQLAKRLNKSVRDSTPKSVPGIFNSTGFVGKSNEVTDNGHYVGNLVDNSYVDYVINVAEAKTYTMVLNTARNSDVSRSVSVSAGATAASMTKLTDITIPKGTDWFVFNPTVANITLPAGKQILRLQSNGSVNISDIMFGSAINIPGQFSSTQFLNKSSEVSVNEKQYLGNLAEGSFAQYLVNVALAGEYKISFNTATGNNNKQRVISVYSGDDKLTQLQVINGDNWEAFAPISGNIYLSAGIQLLKWESTGSVNIEKITVAKRQEGDTVIVLDIPQDGYVYNGLEYKPTLKTFTISGTEISAGDYTLSYSNNTNAGAATVIITGKNEYAGLSKSVPFMIVKKPVFFTFEGSDTVYTQYNPQVIIFPACSLSIQGIYSTDSIGVFKIDGRALTWDDIITEYDYGKMIIDDNGDDEPDTSYINAPGAYPITIRVDGELEADNYTAVFDDGLALIVTDPDNTPNKNTYIRDSKQGIIIEFNPVISAYAKFEIRTLENATVRVAVYDNAGNLVFAKNDVKTKGNSVNISWDLKNSTGRIVANGSYLTVVEAKGVSGKTYRYSARLGIKR
ncbi:MAG: carbohydrate-binding protein [Chitinispirillales bacterium]|jgi:hypothetical protein|nr:carbohydrate-binding protein [Chitinispirillales bacterium]